MAILSPTSSLFEPWPKKSSIKKKKIHSFAKDSIVYLKKGLYTPDLTNPEIGSHYECTGRVLTPANADSIQVLWDNGLVNVYQPSQLILKKRRLTEINGCNSIW